MDDISKSKIFWGLGWSSLSTIVIGLTQLLRLSILSRLLEKSDFGIVAILTFILGLTQVFSDMGFSAAIMSQRKIEHKDFISLYWLQALIFGIAFIAVAALALPISLYYSLPSLVFLIPLALLELPIMGIGKLYDTVLQKNLMFKTIAIRNIIASTSSLILAVGLAILGYGVYSLILSTLFNALFINVWNYVNGQRDYRLTFQKIDYKSIKSLLQIGGYQMGTQILDYLSSKLDILIVSISFGTDGLGAYNLAKELVLKFVMVINSIVSKVMLPVLARYQNDVKELKRVFTGFMHKLTLANIPITGFVFIFSDVIVTLFYGTNYSEVIPLVRIMCLWSLIVVLSMPNGLVAISMKRTDITFVYTIYRILIMSAMLYLFARHSLFGAAVTMLVSYATMFLVNWYMLLKRVLSITFRDYMAIFTKAIIGEVVIVSSTFAIIEIMTLESPILIDVIKLLIYISLLIFYALIFERRTITSIFKTI